jgi:serine O-acetyltransferase
VNRPEPQAIVRAWRAMVDAVREDHRMLCHYDAKYGPERPRAESPALARDFVTRVGFQMLVAYRTMRFFVEAGVPFAPQIASRLIRHAYGSDIHWQAHFEPGVVLVHGMGLAVSRAARVERGAILFHNVTLGMSAEPRSGKVGAPVVATGVHVGAGSTIVGPITLGARSKVTANCFVRDSVPPDSLVQAPVPSVSTRSAGEGRAPSDSET